MLVGVDSNGDVDGEDQCCKGDQPSNPSDGNEDYPGVV